MARPQPLEWGTICTFADLFLEVFQRALTLITLQKYCDTNKRPIVIQEGCFAYHRNFVITNLIHQIFLFVFESLMQPSYNINSGEILRCNYGGLWICGFVIEINLALILLCVFSSCSSSIHGVPERGKPGKEHYVRAPPNYKRNLPKMFRCNRKLLHYRLNCCHFFVCNAENLMEYYLQSRKAHTSAKIS